jgi:hypothetical protein
MLSPAAKALEFEASEEFLMLVDQLRGDMAPDEFLLEAMRLGLAELLHQFTSTLRTIALI